MNLFARHGIYAQGYEWNYRPWIGRESFPPHRLLDGVEVESLTDEKLTNALSFPREAYFYPGDHDGCKCRLSPKLVKVRR